MTVFRPVEKKPRPVMEFAPITGLFRLFAGVESRSVGVFFVNSCELRTTPKKSSLSLLSQLLCFH